MGETKKLIMCILLKSNFPFLLIGELFIILQEVAKKNTSKKVCVCVCVFVCVCVCLCVCVKFMNMGFSIFRLIYLLKSTKEFHQIIRKMSVANSFLVGTVPQIFP